MIKEASLANQKDSIQQAGEVLSQIEILENQHLKSLADNDNKTLDFSKVTAELKQKATVLKPADTASHADCEALVYFFEKPFSALSDLIESYKTTLAADKAAMLAGEKKNKKKDTALRKQLEAKNKTLRELEAHYTNYHQKTTQSQVGEPLHDFKQSLKDWQTLNQHFPEHQYQDIEGLCKVVDLAEIEENDYSLTPGRYVGYSIQIDMDFDYQGRMDEIHQELAELNDEANGLMGQIQGVHID